MQIERYNSENNLKKPTELLLNMMEELSKSPSKIQQAQCMIEIAKVLVDVEKTKIAGAMMYIKAVETNAAKLDL